MCAQRTWPFASSLVMKKSEPPALFTEWLPNFTSSVASPVRKTLPPRSTAMPRVFSFFSPAADAAHSNLGAVSGGAACRWDARLQARLAVVTREVKEQTRQGEISMGGRYGVKALHKEPV